MGESERRGAFEVLDGLTRPKFLIFACALGLSVSIGPIFVFTFSTFIKPLEASLGWSRSAVSLLQSVQGLMLIVATFLLGPVVERLGSRRVIIASSLGLALALAALAVAPPHYWLFIVCFGLIGAAGAGTNTFAYLAVLPQWFTSRLGLIFGLAMTGVGLGQLIMPVLAQRITEAAGWRVSYASLGAVVLLVAVPVALFLIKENPRYNAARDREVDATAPGMTLREALRTPTFWLFWVSMFLLSMVIGATHVHLAPMLIGSGMSPAQAAAYVGMTGGAVLIFRLVGGYILDRTGAFLVGAVACAAGALAQLCLLPPSYPALLVAAPILMGMAVGLEGDVLPYISRQYFGMREYRIIYSRMFLSMMSGPVVGTMLGGVLYDLTGAYSFGLWCFSGVAIFALGLFWLAGRLARPGLFTPVTGSTAH